MYRFAMFRAPAVPVFGQNQVVDLRESAGCWPIQEQFSVNVDKTLHRLGEPEAEKALVYVMRWTYRKGRC